MTIGRRKQIRARGLAALYEAAVLLAGLARGAHHNRPRAGQSFRGRAAEARIAPLWHHPPPAFPASALCARLGAR